jgi:hypothetical protein
MTEDKRKPIVGTDNPESQPAPEADDAEGHSFGLLMGMNALNQARDAEARSRARKLPEEDLPRLSKKWPSLREGKKG